MIDQKRNYWVISPNVSNNKSIESDWKDNIIKSGHIFLGWGDDSKQGEVFKQNLQKGDFVLVAQGANRNKRLYIAGIISSDAIWEHKESTPGEAFNRKLVNILSQKELEELNLDFESATYGNSRQIPALYQLHPETNKADKEIINKLEPVIIKKEKMENLNIIINILKAKHQIILQGAPGTGKTYTAKNIAEQLIFGKTSEAKKEQKEKLENSKQYKLVQFHPSYTYEDFVRGIVVETANGQPEYIAKNKILTDFANKALQNWEYSKKTVEEISKEQWIDIHFHKFVESIEETINNTDHIYQLTDNVKITSIDDDAFRYGNNWTSGTYRMLFKDIKQAYSDDNQTRQDIRNNRNLSKLARHDASYYIRVLDAFKSFLESNSMIYKPITTKGVELQNYVLIIDEINRANLSAVLGELIYALEYRGESVESMYAVDGENKLTLPPNLYIIGTMNTADRSVGQIDYAIRRRFAFVDMLPHVLNDVDGFDYDLFEKVSKLFIENYDEYKDNPKATLKRSAHLSEEFRPEDVWLGHSYFIMKKDDKDCRDMRLNYEIKPILKEYLKDGIFKSSAEDIINNLL